jgi:hypothetical protein
LPADCNDETPGLVHFAAIGGGATSIQGGIYVFHVFFSSAGAFTTISMARDWAGR